MSLKFLDLFAGIGGFRLGMELAGHRSVGYVEWDKHARKAYESIHQPAEEEWTANDIRTVDYRSIPKADVWCFGFPCQDISVAGNQKGFDGDRSSLFYSVSRLLRQTKEWDSERLPSYLFIENVKNLLSVNEGWDFLAAQIELDEIGYECEWDTLNSKDFGVPQNRERVFIIAHLRGRSTRKVFPLTRENGDVTTKLQGLTSGLSDANRVYDSNGLARTLKAEAGGGGAKTGLYLVGNVHPSGRGMNGQVFASSGLAPTLTTNKGEGKKILVNVSTESGIRTTDTSRCLDANYFKGLLANQARTGVIQPVPVLTPERVIKRQNGRRFKQPGEPMFTLTTQDRHGVAIKKIGHLASDAGQTGAVYSADGIAPTQLKQHGNAVTKIMDHWRIRRLTPRECFRLQAFPDCAFDKAATVCSDTQLYKAAGNAVTVSVIKAIAERLQIVEASKLHLNDLREDNLWPGLSHTQEG